MNTKVVIDPGHGGSDSGNTGNGLVEKDFVLLVSNYIKERLDDLGIDNIITRTTDRDLSIDDRVNVIRSAFGDSSDVLVVSNHLNKGGSEGFEVVYALRNNDRFASEIARQVESSGITLNKYYQLRDPEDTAYDYYELLRDTPDYETIMIEYGYVDNATDANKLKNDYLKYAESVVRAIALYLGVSYVPLPGENYYVVVKGDSLWKIANKFGISVDELKSANNLTSNNLNIGQILFIPSEAEEEVNVTYIVKAGDSLWKIAKEYGVSVDSIKSVNNLSSDALQIGQKLIIPESSSGINYIVKAGDSLWKIAKAYGVSVDDIKNANNLSSNMLQIGQKLVIPGGNAPVVYIVKAGDSLWKIAKEYGVSVDSIKSANNLTSNLLQIGQQLNIPFA